MIREWRDTHTCVIRIDEDEPQRESHVFSQVERADDFHLPEMHIGFRPE